MINNKEILFKGLKKSRILFLFSILVILSLTFLFLILTPIGWIILAGFCDAFTKGNLLQKISAPESGMILYKIGTPPVNKGETMFCITS